MILLSHSYMLLVYILEVRSLLPICRQKGELSNVFVRRRVVARSIMGYLFGDWIVYDGSGKRDF